MLDESRPIKIDGETYFVERSFDGSPSIYATDDVGDMYHIDEPSENAISASAYLSALKKNGIVLILARPQGIVQEYG